MYQFANGKLQLMKGYPWIYFMQLASFDEEFQVLKQLFLEKYSPIECDFIAYFRNTWLGELQFWYEGAHPKHPSNNNGLKGANNGLKR